MVKVVRVVIVTMLIGLLVVVRGGDAEVFPQAAVIVTTAGGVCTGA